MGRTAALEVVGWAGRATPSTDFLVAAARLPERVAARAGARSRGDHHPGKVRQDHLWRIRGGRLAGDFGWSRQVVDGPGPRPYAVECLAAQSAAFPRLITTVPGVSAGLWLSQVEHRTLNPAVGGSNPPRPAYLVMRAKTRWRGCLICSGFTTIGGAPATHRLYRDLHQDGMLPYNHTQNVGYRAVRAV